MQRDYYSALANVVLVSARDDAQKRRAIYELARGELRQQLRRRGPTLGAAAQAQELRALEAAIARVEADLARRALPAADSVAGSSTVVGSAVETVAPSAIEILPPAQHRRPPQWRVEAAAEPPPSQRRRSRVPALASLLGAVIVGGIAYWAVEHGLGERRSDAVAAAENLPDSAQRPAMGPIGATIPMPSSYGVYAIGGDGRLLELAPLPIRAPDPRVATSGTFASPSSTRLPNGRAQFVVYMREIVNQAPEKVVVRVVAPVAGGDNSDQGAGWAIRSTSYDMKVAPVDGNRAMLLIRPALADFSFPAGRYALLVKSVAYDFSVDGVAADMARCVERSGRTNPSAAGAPCPN